MYSTVFKDYADHRHAFGRVHVLPSSVFFYGMKPDDWFSVDIAPGKSLVISLMAVGEPGETVECKLFFELNGQPIQIGDLVMTLEAMMMKTSAPRAALGQDGPPGGLGRLAGRRPGTYWPCLNERENLG